MNPISPAVNFCLNLTQFQTALSRRLDSRLGGLGLNELIILYHLSQANEQKMRRIDLAEKVGLTASGVTRLLLPMEKIGLIKREANEHDARVSYASITTSGATKLSEGLERAEIFFEELIPENKIKELITLTELLTQLSKNI